MEVNNRLDIIQATVIVVQSVMMTSRFFTCCYFITRAKRNRSVPFACAQHRSEGRIGGVCGWRGGSKKGRVAGGGGRERKNKERVYHQTREIDIILLTDLLGKG